MVKIYKGDTLIAEQISGSHIIKSCGTGVMLPPTLFVDLFNGSTTIGKFLMWLEGRVFPKGRENANEVLESLGLEEYDALTIAKINKARVHTDKYWAEW